MIYNFWVWMDPTFVGEVRAKFALSKVVGDVEFSQTTPAVTYPLLNSLTPEIAILFRGRAPTQGWDVWNCYLDSAGISQIVPLREGLQELEEFYPQDIKVLGAWEWGGQPIGGVGSPWFPKPANFLDYLPDNVQSDVVLLAGQGNRSFV